MNYVADASVILAVLFNEAVTSAEAFKLVHGADVSVINGAEVTSKLFDRGEPEDKIYEWIGALDITLHDFTEADMRLATDMRRQTRGVGLSLADHACLALGQRLQAPVLTADRAWQGAYLHQPIEYLR